MTKDKKRYINLGWTLLECKYFYYCDPLSPHIESDIWYDTLESEYIKLAEKLELPTSASDRVGFPDTPSGRLVAGKCTGEKFKYTIKPRR